MYPINAVRTIGKAIVYVSFNISIGSSSFLLYNSIIIFQNNFLFHFTSHNQSLTVNKIDLLIDDNKNCKFNCDGYKYLLICAVNDSKIINVDLLKLIGSINLGFIRYSSESYIGTCSMNIKPTYITLHGFYNKGYSYSTYQVYGIK